MKLIYILLLMCSSTIIVSGQNLNFTLDALEELERNSEFKEALNQVNLALESYPQEAEFHCFKGRILGKQFKNRAALNALDNAIELNPSLEQAFFEKAIIYSNQKNYQQAIEALTSAINLNNKALNYFLLRSKLYIKNNNTEKGIRDLDQCISLDSNNADLFLRRGNVKRGALLNYYAFRSVEDEPDLEYLNKTYPYALDYCDDLEKAAELNPNYKQTLEKYCTEN